MNTTDILIERGKRYGTFTGHAALSQSLKEVLREHANTHDTPLAPDHKNN